MRYVNWICLLLLCYGECRPSVEHIEDCDSQNAARQHGNVNGFYYCHSDMTMNQKETHMTICAISYDTSHIFMCFYLI